jgi:hypothetical protein
MQTGVSFFWEGEKNERRCHRDSAKPRKVADIHWPHHAPSYYYNNLVLSQGGSKKLGRDDLF